MGTISRWMPPLPKPKWTPAAIITVSLFLCGIVLLAFKEPFVRWLLGAIVVLSVAGVFSHRRHMAALAQNRTSDDIGTFARAFDRREIDPWVIRAVWDALQPYVEFRGQHLPLRASDRLGDDLLIDELDLIADVDEIADRIARVRPTKADYERAGIITSVGELVGFINALPKLGSK